MQLLSVIAKQKDIQKKILFSLFILAVYRLGSHIPIGGVDLQQLSDFFSQSSILGFFNLFSGGGLSRFSIFALGILPYINASIIMQLMVVVYPKLKELSEEGEYGRKIISQYTRYLAIFLSFIQGFFMAVSFQSFVDSDISLVLFLLYSTLSLVAGSAVVMWFGELITESGLGNGASLLIFVSIISQMPMYVRNTYVLLSGGASSFGVLVMIAIFLFMIVAIVYIQEAQRRIHIQYAKRVVGRKMYSSKSTYIPLRLIQGGVMPIIFASALLQFPLLIFQYVEIDFIQNFLSTYYRYDGFLYNAFFCILIFFFTYFYTAITFNPRDLADNLKKHGGFISGIRPGEATVQYLDKIISRLTFIGAFFLSLIALAPIIGSSATQIDSFMGLGGTALLIIVGVAMDLVKQIDMHTISKRYEKLI